MLNEKIIQIMPVSEENTQKLKNIFDADTVILGVALLEDAEGIRKLDYIISSCYGEPTPCIGSEY